MEMCMGVTMVIDIPLFFVLSRRTSPLACDLDYSLTCEFIEISFEQSKLSGS
jgi:hypothetical protein